MRIVKILKKDSLTKICNSQYNQMRKVTRQFKHPRKDKVYEYESNERRPVEDCLKDVQKEIEAQEFVNDVTKSMKELFEKFSSTQLYKEKVEKDGTYFKTIKEGEYGVC